MKRFLFKSMLLVLPVLTLFNVSFLSSCRYYFNPRIPSNNDPHIQYIKDRTFSIASVGTTPQGQTAWVRGTGWIINKNSSSDSLYEYWMATNMHVSYEIFDLNPSFNAKRMLYSFCSGSEDYISGRKQYRSFNISSQSPSKKNDIILDPNHEFFSYETPANKLNSIDFSVLKVDFTNYVSNDNSLKQKLDKLNDWYINHNNTINEFADINCEKYVSNVYCAGYAASKHLDRTNWARIKFSNIVYNDKNISHGIPTDDNVAYRSTAPNYIYKNGIRFSHDEIEYPLQGGASGSMLLSDDYKVLGIYWGGIAGSEIITGVSTILPCFEVFKSPKADFIKYYI